MCVRAEARIPPSSRRATHAQVKFNAGGFIKDCPPKLVTAMGAMCAGVWLTWSVAAASVAGRKKK